MKGQPVCDIQIVYLTKSDLNAIVIGCKDRTFCGSVHNSGGLNSWA